MTLCLQNEIEALFRQKMMEFLGWAEANWKITERDLARPDTWLADKSQDYIDGYNTGIEGMQGAFECWNEEFGG